METIKNYLESLFKGLPKNEEILRLKSDLYFNMEDKYTELKSQGKSENEAIGIVISEFGNIDELLNEMGINIEKEETSIKVLSKEDVTNYIKTKISTSRLTALGVFLIMIGASLLIFLSALVERYWIFSGMPMDSAESIPFIILLIFVIISVPMFIVSDKKLEKYKYIENGNFRLDFDTKAFIESKRELSGEKCTINIIAIILCIMGAIPIIGGSIIKGDLGSEIGISITILIVAIAVVLFITNGAKSEVYKVLLKEENYNPKVKKDNKVISIVASIVWPITVCIFLVSGLIYDLWDKAWIVFPIVGILFGSFSAVYSGLKEKN